jgi:hypothetical protein
MPGVRHSGVSLQICWHLRRHQVHRFPHLPPRLVAHQVRQSSHSRVADTELNIQLKYAPTPTGRSPLQINETQLQRSMLHQKLS